MEISSSFKHSVYQARRQYSQKLNYYMQSHSRAVQPANLLAGISFFLPGQSRLFAELAAGGTTSAKSPPQFLLPSFLFML